jgi:hypothetical protein
MALKKSMLAATFCALTIVGAGATAASAGEVTGNGKPTPAPDQANSICVFSGQNDDPTAPTTEPLGLNGPGGRSQSFGQENRLGLVDPHAFNPGDACRGGSNFERD